jgi:predicted transcriptional regulator
MNISTVLSKVEDRPRLIALVKFIATKPRSARSIAEKFEVTKPTAYAQLRALESRGITLKSEHVREGSKGPLAAVYSIGAAKVKGKSKGNKKST